MRTEYIKIRLTSEEKKRIKKLSEDAHMDVSNYVRFCCLVNPPKIFKKKGN